MIKIGDFMKIYLVRHPQTFRNEDSRPTGWEDTQYTTRGWREFDKIVGFFSKNKKIKQIFSSDLPRVLKLAKEISKNTSSEMHITKRLREMNFKQTKPEKEFETHKEFENRIERFIKKYDSLLKEDSVIVSHAGVIRELIKDIVNKKELKETTNCPRNKIFVIERHKNEDKLKKLEL